MKNNFFKKLGKGRFVLIPVLAVAFLALVSYVVMLLWNQVLAEVVNVQQITLVQAAGLFVLSKILFGFGRMGGFGRDKMMFKHRLAERVKGMSPEELARFKQGFGHQGFGRFSMCRPDAQEKSE